jgi:hypothetical protein
MSNKKIKKAKPEDEPNPNHKKDFFQVLKVAANPPKK